MRERYSSWITPPRLLILLAALGLTLAIAAPALGWNQRWYIQKSGSSQAGWGELTYTTDAHFAEGEAYRNTTAPNNHCINTLWDWSVSSGHWDARHVRTCHKGTLHKRALDEDIGGTADGQPTSRINGMQKRGACRVSARYGGFYSCKGTIGSPAVGPPNADKWYWGYSGIYYYDGD